MVIAGAHKIGRLKIADNEEAAVLDQAIDFANRPEQRNPVDPMQDEIDNDQIKGLFDRHRTGAAANKRQGRKTRFAIADGIDRGFKPDAASAAPSFDRRQAKPVGRADLNYGLRPEIVKL